MLKGRVAGMGWRRDMATQVLEVWVTISKKIPQEQKEKANKSHLYAQRHVQLGHERSKKELVLSWVKWLRIQSKETISCCV